MFEFVITGFTNEKTLRSGKSLRKERSELAIDVLTSVVKYREEEVEALAYSLKELEAVPNLIKVLRKFNTAQ
ncbi:hypothetical protein CEXT_425021 [Caerostris extrusa]|uniref:Uncharacterized protein n=1 Tax=Caerostris extrusa TaxID=172846 RepID=A0AAV4WIV5_CAEEX|nr:hypothetical protein CEXT_425021 [Caerostris extrusa]